MKPLLLAAILLSALVSASSAAPTIFLVRHAEKARGLWIDRKDPQISRAGRERAQALARILRDVPFTAIYVTELKRTQQTAAPTASLRGLRATIVPAKATPALVARLKKERGHVLVVGHSNTIPDILKTLGVRHPPAIDEADYDNLFVVTPGPRAQLLRLHFGR